MAEKILLIPTTDSVYRGWRAHYEYVSAQKHFLFDGKWLTPQKMQDAYFGICPDYGYSSMPVYKKAVYLYLKREIIKSYLKKNGFDLVIVSNDNAYPAFLFVDEAKKLGIKTVLHQHAGMMYLKGSKIRGFSKIFRKILGLPITLSLGSNVDEVWLWGEKWKEYVDNENVKIVGSCYYKFFKNRTREYKSDPKKYIGNAICFFSQPLYENGLLDKSKIEMFYDDLKKMGDKLTSKGYAFIIKPHPQEKYIYNTQASKYIKQIDDLDLCLDGSDIIVAAYSQTLIQAKLNSKTTVSFAPLYIPPKQRYQMKEFADLVISKPEEIINIFNLQSSKKNYKNVVNTDIPCEYINQLIKEV